MPTIDLTPYKPTAGATSDPAAISSAFTTIQNAVNSLDNNNVSASAGIALSKLGGFPSPTNRFVFARGDGSWSKLAGAAIRNAANQNVLTGAAQTITFGTTVVDAGGFVSGNTFVFPTGSDGAYIVGAGAEWAATAAASAWRDILIQVDNGVGGLATVASARSFGSNTTGGVFKTNCTGVAVVAAGWIIRVQASHSEAGTVVLNGAGAYSPLLWMIGPIA